MLFSASRKIAFLWFVFYARCGKEEEEVQELFDKCGQIKNDVVINRLNFFLSPWRMGRVFMGNHHGICFPVHFTRTDVKI